MTKKAKKPTTPDNLYQRGDTWWIRYNAGGKKIRRSLGTSNLREAKQLRDRILAKRSVAAKFGLEEPKPATPRMTFGQLAEKWLAAREASGNFAPATIEGNRMSMKTHIIPWFGHMPIHTITVENIEAFIGHLRSKYARPTVARYYAHLRTCIHDSIKRGWFDCPNPLDRLQRAPTAGPGRDTTLTEDEAARLLAQLSGRLHYMVGLAIYTGLRWGEVHGLAWSDLALDDDPPTLTVCRSFRGPTKNQASADTVPVSTHVVTLMKRWQQEHPPDTPWVFPNPWGEVQKRHDVSANRRIHEATKKAGIDKHVTPHVFRHSFVKARRSPS